MRALPVLLVLLTFAGVTRASDPRDPWEGFNRKVFVFNETVDRWFMKPVARGYQAVTPEFVDRSVTRFFANLHDVVDIPNYALQGDAAGSRDNLLRVIANTSVGLGGLLDPASAGGIADRDTDFGTTLGTWGVGAGNYLMLPFMGPGTVRSVAAMPFDWLVNPLPLPWTVVESEGQRYFLDGLYVVDTRARLLDYERAVIGDRYSFVRDVYLQRSEYKINGDAARDPFLDESFDDAPAEDGEPAPVLDEQPGGAAPPPAAVPAETP